MGCDIAVEDVSEPLDMMAFQDELDDMDGDTPDDVGDDVDEYDGDRKTIRIRGSDAVQRGTGGI